MGQKKRGAPGVFSKKGISASGRSTSSHTNTQSPTQTQKAPHSTTTSSSRQKTSQTQSGRQTQSSTANAQQQQGRPVVAQQGGGGGLMGNMATTAIGSMAGVMAANAMMNSFGNNENVDINQRDVQQAEMEAMNTIPCGPQMQSFFKCLENNPSTIGQCQWAYDMFQQCKLPNNQ